MCDDKRLNDRGVHGSGKSHGNENSMEKGIAKWLVMVMVMGRTQRKWE